tara:strand:- start:867 stop:2087 length:1221 start_codon:yes stop_codon:yes gene_type:complete
MSQNNDVFKVLVADNNIAVLAAGSAPSALAVGQVGFFDAETNISTVTPTRNFYVAVGVDIAGGTTLNSLAVSAGQNIQSKNIRALSFRGHTASQPMIVEVSGFQADCDTDYAVKVEFRNQEIYRRQGFNQFTKTYTVRTSCCEDCATCPSGDANEITSLLVAEIALDESGILTAERIARDTLTIATHGTAANYAIGDVILEADLTAMIAFNALQPDETTKVFSDVRLTTVELAVKNFCNVNLLYYYPRQTKIIVSLVEGFSCNGSSAVTQEYAAEEGNGYDIQQKEFHSGGWDNNPGPYRLSTATGMAKTINYLADKGTPYDQFWLTYGHSYQAGFLQGQLDDLATLVAIPEANTTARDSFVAVLDAVVAGLGFDPLADDVAVVSATSTVVEPTTDFDDVDTDGIA